MKVFNDLSGNGKGVGLVKQAVVYGKLTGVGLSDVIPLWGLSNAQLSGTFVATLQLVRSLNGGATYQPVTAWGVSNPYTGPCSESFDEPEIGAMYAWQCTAYTSGVINYRISK